MASLQLLLSELGVLGDTEKAGHMGRVPYGLNIYTLLTQSCLHAASITQISLFLLSLLFLFLKELEFPPMLLARSITCATLAPGATHTSEKGIADEVNPSHPKRSTLGEE